MSSGPPPVNQSLNFDIAQGIANLERWSGLLESFIQRFGNRLNIAIGSNSDSAFGTLKAQAEGIGGAIDKANSKIEQLNNTPGPEKIINALVGVEQTLRVTLPAGADIAAKAIQSLNSILNNGTNSIDSTRSAVEHLRGLFLSLGLTIDDNKAKILNLQAQIGKTVAGRKDGTISGPVAEADIKSFQTSIESLETQNKNLSNIQSIVSKSIASTKDELKLLSDAEKQATKDTLALANAEEDRLKRVRAAQDALFQSRNKQQVGIEKDQTQVNTNRPFVERGAVADETNAQTQLAKATQLVAEANERVEKSNKKGSDRQKASDATALTHALQAERDATLSLAAAQQKLQVARNPNATKEQIKQANDLVSSTSNQARASVGLANASATVADKLRGAGKGAGEAHKNLLAMLGVSRLLPGELGKITSAAALISEGASTSTGALISVAGTAFAVITKLFQAGAKFNSELNKQRAQAEGLGLKIEEVKAFESVLSQTDGSIENFAVGIKKVNEALTGIGEEAGSTKNLLELVFAGTEFKLDGLSTKDIILGLAKNINVLEKSGLGSAIAAQIFGRSWDEVKGRLLDIAAQEEEFEKAIKDSGITAKEAQESAREYAREIARLELAWDKLARVLAKPVKITIEGLGALASVISLVGKDSDDDLFTKKAESLEKRLQQIDPAFRNIVDKFISSASLNKANFLSALLDSKAEAQKKIREQQEKFVAELNETLSESNKVSLDESGALLVQGQRFGGKDQLSDIVNIKKAIESVGTAKKIVETEKEKTDAEAQTKEERAKRLALVKENATDQERINAQKDIDIANLEIELDKQNKLISEARKKVAQDELVLKKKDELPADKVAEVERKKKEADEDLLALTVERDRIQESIAQLRKKSSGRTKDQRDDAQQFSLDVERLRDELDKLDPLSKEFDDKAIEVRKKLVDRINALEGGVRDKTDPGALRELTNRTRELRRQLDDINKQFEQARQIRFSSQFEEVANQASQSILSEEQANQRKLSDASKLFDAGIIDLQELLARETDAAGILDAITQRFISEKLLLIAVRKDQVTESRDAGNISPNDANKTLRDLQNQEDALNQERARSAKASEDKKRDAEEKAASQLLQNRQRLGEIELSIQESVNNRKLELLRRASEQSLDARKAEIEAIDKLEREQIERQIANNNKRLTGLIQNAFGGVGLLLNESVKDSLPTEKFSRIIETLRASGSGISREQLDILESTLRLKQKLDDLDQKTSVSKEDLAISQAQKILDLTKQTLDIKSKTLDVEQNRLNLLNSTGGISELDTNERQLSIDKKRLDILRQRIEVTAKESAIALNAQIQKTQDAGLPVNIQSILNEPAFQRLAADLRQLQGEAISLSDAIALSSSVLGRLSAGLNDLSEVLSKLPEPFNHIKEVVDGIRKAIDLANGIQIQTPEDKLVNAADKAGKTTISSAEEFARIVVDAARQATLDSSGLPKGKIDTSNVLKLLGLPDLSKDKSNPSEKGKIISKVFDGVSNLVAGIFAPTAGGKVSGFGNAAGSFLSLIPSLASAAPFIGPIASALGGVIDIFGSVIRKRTEKIAAEIQTEFQTITKQFKNGTATLGQTIGKLEDQLVSARAKLGSGKTGKKGGREALAKIETDINSEIENLRQQAKETQSKFLDDLAKLRLDPDIRAAKSASDEVFSRVKDFIRSFEDAAEATKHLGEAEEFATRSLSEQKEQQIKNLKDLLNKQLESERAFQSARQAIQNEGRVVSPFQVAIDRLSRLFELESRHADEQAKNLEEQTTLQKTIDFLDSSFTKLDTIISKFSKSIDNVANQLNQNFGGVKPGGGNFSNPNIFSNQILSGLNRAGATTFNQSNSNVFNISVSANDRNAARSVSDEIESRLRRLGKINVAAGWINSDRPFSS